LLRLYPSRIDVGWFIDYFCTYPCDPSDRCSDRSSEPFTSLDQSGNSLAAHLAFGHLPGLHSPEGARSAKNGTPGEESAITKSWEHLETLGQEFWIGTEGPAEPPFPASDRCLREAGGKAGRRVGVGACRRRTRSPATDIDTLVFGPATKMAKRGRFASNADPPNADPLPLRAVSSRLLLPFSLNSSQCQRVRWSFKKPKHFMFRRSSPPLDPIRADAKIATVKHEIFHTVSRLGPPGRLCHGTPTVALCG